MNNSIFLKLFLRISLPISILAILLFLTSVKALTISPPIKEFEADPGGLISNKILVVNEEVQDLQIDIEIKNFENAGDSGAPKILNEAFGLAKWIEIDNKSFSLKPRGKKEVLYKISIPEDAPPGGHFSAILVKAKAIDKSGAQGTFLENRIAALILLRVSGDILEKGEVKEFFSEQEKWGSLPAKFSIRFENQGNVFLKPYGKIIVRDILGRKTEEIAINDQGGNVLPKSGRRFDAIWRGELPEDKNTKSLFGLYRADLEMFYGSNNFKQSAGLNLFIFNWKGIGLVGGLATVVIIFIAIIFKKLKKRKFFIERL